MCEWGGEGAGGKCVSVAGGVRRKGRIESCANRKHRTKREVEMC